MRETMGVEAEEISEVEVKEEDGKDSARLLWSVTIVTNSVTSSMNVPPGINKQTMPN